MSKKKQYCSNCNKYGHTNKECNEPITSAGVICLCLDNNIKSYFLIEGFGKKRSIRQ